MYSTCACKRGIFALRDCGSPAAVACTTCGRQVCEEHLSKRTTLPTCVECAARDQQDQAETGDVDYAAPDYAYSYRQRFYGTSGYRPLFIGSYYDPYYDSYDVRSFDEELALTPEAEDDEGPGGFVES